MPDFARVLRRRKNAEAVERDTEPDHGAQPAEPAEITQCVELPKEIRYMVYECIPRRAWIYITDTSLELQQPATSRICKAMRGEALDIHYGKNKFVIDFRQFLSIVHPTKLTIFTNWTTAIGDENAGRIRSLSCLLPNFSVHFKISNKKPRFSLKFRSTSGGNGVVEMLTTTVHDPTVAAHRACRGLLLVLKSIEEEREGRPLRAEDLQRMVRTVDGMPR